jgi:hypothetical protein
LKILNLFNHFSAENVNHIHSKKQELNLELVGSWTVEVGDLDQALHLWQYSGGFQNIDKAQALLAKDNVSHYFKILISY